MTLLSIRNLSVKVGEKFIIDDISFDLLQGSILALAGGSGSGKTTVSLSILNLLPQALRKISGNIIFEGKDLSKLFEEEMRSVRGSRIGMVFQEPLSAFNPLLTIGKQIDEVLKIHTSLHQKARYQKVLDVLSDVELPDPKRVYESYPHQLSGGMRQRAMIAQAIVCHPSLVIADEPTSSLDVTLQVRIMELFRRLRKERNMSIIFITHDWGVVSHLADEVIVLQQGRLVEQGKVADVMKDPQHVYTRQLIEAF